MATKQLVELVAKFEGFRGKAYQDVVGVWTIGYGETKGVRAGDKVSKAEALAQLSRRLDEFQEGVKRRLGPSISLVNQNQLDAMTSLAYNIGLGAFGRSTVVRRTRKGRFPEAADAFLMWNKAGGRVLRGLARRREMERKLFLA